MLAATYLRTRPRGHVARRLGRRCLRPVRAAQHAMVGMMGLWAAAAWGSEPDRPEKSTATVAEPADKMGRVSHVVILGDSISQGMGADPVELSYASLIVANDDHRYPDDVSRDLKHLFGPNLRVLNFAHDGDDTGQVLHQQIPKMFQTLEAEAALGIGGSYLANGSFVLPGRLIVLMTAGGNDLQQAIRPNTNFCGGALKRSLVNIGTILAYVRDSNHFQGGTSSYFASVYDVTDGEDQLSLCYKGMNFPGMSQALEIWGTSFAELAASNGARLVDALNLFRGHGFNFYKPDNAFHDPADPTLWIYDRDCIHPNNLGHHMLRRAFLQQIERDFLGGSSTPIDPQS